MKVGEVYTLLGMDFSQFNKDERTAKRRTETLGSSLSGVLKNAFSFTLGMGFFSAVQTGFRSTVGTMISFNAQMEQAQIGFTTMLGSAQRAKRFLDDVAKFAAKTPFEFPDLLDASKRMLAYGFAAEDVLPTMQAVGNATAAVGLGAQGIDRIILALGQMRAKGKVSGEEMRQLTETGIPAWEILAEAMGKSTAEVMDLSQRGLIPADRAIKMFTEGMNKRFPDMMSKMENTWEGVTSTIKDVWRMTIGEVTKGLFQGAVGWLQKVRDVATGFYDAFRAGGLSYAIEQTFGAKAAASINTLASALKGLWGIVSGTAQTIVRYWSVIGPLTMGVVKAFLAFKAATFVVNVAAAAVRTFTMANLAMHGSLVNGTGLLKLISDIVLYYKCLIPATVGTFGFSTALTYLKAALMAVQTALGAVIWPILIIGVLLMGGISLWTKYQQAVQSAAQKAQMEKMAQQQKEYMDAVNAAAQGTDNQSDALKNLGKAASKNLQSFDEIHSLASDTADLSAGALGDILGGTPTLPEMPEFDMSAFTFDMDTAIAEAKAEMGGFWGWLKQSASETWGKVKTWAGNVWEGAKTKWATFKEWVGSWAGPLWDSVKTKWTSFKGWAADIWEGAKGKWGNFKEWAGRTWDGMKTKASETWGNIKTGAATGWEKIKTTVATKWDAFKVGAANTWEQVKTGASIAWQNIKTDAVTGWEGIKTTAATKWESFKAGAAETWEKVRTEASTAWQNLKADAATGWENIKTTAATKWDSFKTGAAETWEQVKTNAGTAWENLKTTINTGWGNIRNDTNTAWDNIKADLTTAWENLKTDASTAWDRLKTTISNGWAKIKEGAKTWGQRIVEAFTGGMDSVDVGKAAANVTWSIERNMGFESPTKEGPGRYADEWAPNLMKMYTKGILSNVSMVQSAASQVARSLSPMSTIPAPVFAGMSDPGGGSGSRPGGFGNHDTSGSSQAPTTLIVKIGERTLIDQVISGINRKSRAAGEAVITV